MRKIKEMSDISVPKGFDKEDGMSVCRDQYRQQMDRHHRITGGDAALSMFDAYSSATPVTGGFIPRNNVRERN